MYYYVLLINEVDDRPLALTIISEALGRQFSVANVLKSEMEPPGVKLNQKGNWAYRIVRLIVIFIMHIFITTRETERSSMGHFLVTASMVYNH